MHYLIVSIVVFVVGVFLLKFYKRRSIIKARRNVSLIDIHMSVFPNQDVPFAEFELIWKSISKKFRVNPELLSPEDRFDQELKELDPWLIDGAITELNDDLLAKLGSRNEKVNTINTLREYVVVFITR